MITQVIGVIPNETSYYSAHEKMLKEIHSKGLSIVDAPVITLTTKMYGADRRKSLCADYQYVAQVEKMLEE